MNEALPLLMLAAGDDVQGLGMAEILGDSQLFILTAKEAQLAYALIIRGNELWVQAAGGRGKIDLTLLMVEQVEKQAAALGVKSVAFHTRRNGLVRKTIKAGYEIDGYILRKKIK